MVLEYSNLPLFQELNQWQAAEKGVPSKLKTLEMEALKDEDADAAPHEDGLAKWRTPSMRSWLRMQPRLSGADLRDYFWLARDRTGSTLAGVTMVPPNVQVVLHKLLTDNNAGEVALGLKLSYALPAPESAMLLDLLKQDAERHPDRLAAVSALHKLAIQKVAGAGAKLIETARSIPADSLKASVPQNIAEIGQTEPQLRGSAVSFLKELAAHNTTKAGKAASKALESMQKKN